MNHPLRILFLEDHPIFRKALTSFLGTRPEFDIVAAVDTIGDALAYLAAHPVDLILSDLHLPDTDACELVERLATAYRHIPLLLLSSECGEQRVLDVIRAGAKGYVTKGAAMEELIIALKALAGGNSYFSKEISANLLVQLSHRNRPAPGTANSPHKLTPREWEVLQYIHDELTNREIAEQLFISPRTVDTHKRNLIKKLRVKNTVGLVKFFQRAQPHPGNAGARSMA